MKQTPLRVVCGILLLCTLFSAGCISDQIHASSYSDNTDVIGTWTINGTFLANGELCNAAFTLHPDGTGLRELISATTGYPITAENLTWERTGELDNIKICYEDGFVEITSLRWLKET